MTATILVTGGAGYIGSHTCVELLQKDYDVIVLDNLSNSSPEALRRVEKITGKSVTFVEGDVRDRNILRELFGRYTFDSVIHFAGLKAVGESCQIPLDYYDNNVSGTVILAQEMAAHGVFNLVFSSSATVYGDPASLPIREDFPLSATNPYGRSKLIIEEILGDLYKSDNRWNVALLRYFNPAGAHKSGLIGEDPNDIPNNLMPYISQVAIGLREKLSIFGSDYPTEDGTGVRDYIHVVDLAKGHACAIEKLRTGCGLKAWNLGVGNGHSVLQMVAAFEKASEKPVPYQLVERRPGDIAACWADPALAKQDLNWVAEKGLTEIMADAWRWQSTNPKGYRD
ncbi:UDP-glucose 4-epimerase GalE [Parendozoicomonas sp. Alg238-R29]|uniref:UDP-glucose 4-epimerase GalE n=1 Tax=Parendozoicomonas sp. Alg238-R29 TaxID=2993446 RepID=UPI00248D8CDE|nr:UDP-glucose 4-epimerase GalE [Parendozoicomonas sp. Alg238-R29]